MSVVSELIRSEKDGGLSFGDYTLSAKSKLDNFSHAGDVYKVKTFQEITKLERNGMFICETLRAKGKYSIMMISNWLLVIHMRMVRAHRYLRISNAMNNLRLETTVAIRR